MHFLYCVRNEVSASLGLDVMGPSCGTVFPNRYPFILRDEPEPQDPYGPCRTT